MKKQRNHSKLKDQENSLERISNETDLSCLPDPEFKKEVMKILMELRKAIEGFPDGTVVKNPPANAGDTGSSPGLGRSHMPRNN